MNFVIFSHSYLPKDSAEAFCTARFANALAEAGHHVHVVTVAHPQELPDDLELELAPAVQEVTRVPIKAGKPIWSRVRFQTPELDALNYAACIKALKTVLEKYEQPILVSRMYPAASGIIAWHCRKKAALWIHHFSDPFPIYWKSGLLGWIMNKFTMRWAKRFLLDSDFCSVTCHDVIRFFKERVTSVPDDKFVLVPHIGEPMLLPECNWHSPCPDKPYIAHAGSCYNGRYPAELARELLLAKQAGYDIAFVQAGKILEKTESVLRQGNIDFRKIVLHGPREASAIFQDATINLVIDLKVDFCEYTPFIPSKFVYLLFTDKPILVFSRKDCWMYQLAKDNPEAGIWFADVHVEGEMARKIQDILRHKPTSQFDRTRLREFFSKKNAIQDLIRHCEAYDKGKH